MEHSIGGSTWIASRTSGSARHRLITNTSTASTDAQALLPRFSRRACGLQTRQANVALAVGRVIARWYWATVWCYRSFDADSLIINVGDDAGDSPHAQRKNEPGCPAAHAVHSTPASSPPTNGRGYFLSCAIQAHSVMVAPQAWHSNLRRS